MPVQIVIDTNVLVAAARSNTGASFELLRLFASGDTRWEWNISTALLVEYEVVLKREQHRQGRALIVVDHFLDDVAARANRHAIFYLIRPFLADPDDELVLELALASKSSYIVIHNRGDFAEARRFGLLVLTPGEFLNVNGSSRRLTIISVFSTLWFMVKTYPLYLNGEFITTSKTFPVKNPATGEAFAQMSAIDRPRLAQAIQDAHTAFAGWRALTAKARGEYLRKIAAELERRKDEIARTMTMENGKPLAQSIGEMGMTVDHLTWFAEEARRGYGRVIPHQTDGKRNIVVKTPVGVVGAIAPWNFPLVLSIRKIAPALAAGCTAILKPASYTPLSNVAFAEACDAVKLPKGVFQLVAGSAAEIAEEFLQNPLLKKISFTGSTEVGQRLIAGAAAQVKMLSLELGGLNPVLVFDDADLEKAAEGAMLAKFRNTGQSCIAANRIYVQRGIYDKFVNLMVEKTRAMKVGDGFEPDVQIGAMIDENAVKKAQEHVDDAVKRGARVLCGGKRVSRPGYFFEATVMVDVPQDSLCMREETFAPVAAIAPFSTEAEAVTLANSSPFGLAAYAFTRDLSRAFRLMESIDAGMLGLNDGLPTTTNAPFGGVKQSGWGRELGGEGLDSFLETKHISIAI